MSESVVSYEAGRTGRETHTMPRKGRKNEEIVAALHQVEGGEKVAEVCRRARHERADVLPMLKKRVSRGSRRPLRN